MVSEDISPPQSGIKLLKGIWRSFSVHALCELARCIVLLAYSSYNSRSLITWPAAMQKRRDDFSLSTRSWNHQLSRDSKHSRAATRITCAVRDHVGGELTGTESRLLWRSNHRACTIDRTTDAAPRCEISRIQREWLLVNPPMPFRRNGLATDLHQLAAGVRRYFEDADSEEGSLCESHGGETDDEDAPDRG